VHAWKKAAEMLVGKKLPTSETEMIAKAKLPQM